MNTPRLLAIGGTGFIGHHLLKSVQQKGWKITSVSLNLPTEERFVHGVRYLHFDLSDRGLVKKYLVEDFAGGLRDHGAVVARGKITRIRTLTTCLPNLHTDRVEFHHKPPH